jgi:hypothetical protein
MHPELRKAMKANRAKRKLQEAARQDRNAEIAAARKKPNPDRPAS